MRSIIVLALTVGVLLLGTALPVWAQGGFTALPELARVESWQAPADGVAVAALPNGVLTVTITDLKENELRVVRLAQPVALAGVDAFNYWTCFPAASEGFGVSLTPLFTDKNGKAVDLGKDDFIDSHIGAPNSRKSGLWCYDSWVRGEKAVTFTGFAVQVTYHNSKAAPKPHTIYVKDFGLERTDYRTVPLYYMVGNFRDNFCDPSFNNVRARALTNENSGSATPYLLLDNLLDQVKQRRPSRVNLRYFVYDMRDTLVYANSLDNLAVDTPVDFLQQLPIPITAPGTYNIKGESFNAGTGEYFTTDWVKLIIIKGKAHPLTPQPYAGLLAINPSKPFDRLEQTDKREISFQIGTMVNPASGPVELRYTVMPYTTWVPGWSAVRSLTFDHTVPVTKAGALTVPYEQKRTVELVVAELWQGGRRLVREERPIGVANGLDKTPAFTNRAQMPSLNDLAGPGKNWMNTTIVTNPGYDPYEALARNIDETKKLTPNQGFMLDMNRVEPMPGVYDWDYLTPYFDLAAQKGCRLLPYMNLKWPMDWSPVEFQVDDTGCVHRLGNMYGYMAGKYLYFSGTYSPGIRRDFITQFARRYLNHPGLLGYYIENEHADTKWMAWPVSRSYHEGYRKEFAAFAAARYRTLDKLNAAYGTHYTAFSEVQLPSALQNARKVALADVQLFRRQATENAVLRDEVDAARAVDPQRPIIVYGLSGAESDTFMKRLVAQGCMMANGGIHSDINWAYEYERPNAIPGLRYRMEPHDCYHYDPIKNGYDEMIFGMLGTGGRGLGFHFFLPGWENFSYDKAMQPGQTTGYDKVVKYLPVMSELSTAEKQHDAVGVLELYQNMFGDPWRNDAWTLHRALYVRLHYSPRITAAESDPTYLKDAKVIFVAGTTVSTRQVTFLKAFLQAGGHVVLAENTGTYRLEDPDNAQAALLATLGIDRAVRGAQLPGLTVEHDLYTVGAGQVVLLHRPDYPLDGWSGIISTLLPWGGVTGRLADSADPDMQLHVLQSGSTYYLATTHRNELGGPADWSGQVRWCAPLPAGRYRVTEMMSGTALGIFTPTQLAAGFDAGAYSNLQMKIFKIAPVRE
ncbi:MAG TPA: beta-galactosidase [Armatimonadota bacterium]